MPKSAEEKREYRRQYYLKNKEKITKRKKEYNLKNKEKIKEYNKEWYEKNKDYHQTPEGKKKCTILNWKKRGLICPDYDSIYCHYLNATECDNCDVTFGEFGDGSGTFKCMDHNHETGEFRNFLCKNCNVRRG